MTNAYLREMYGGATLSAQGEGPHGTERIKSSTYNGTIFIFVFKNTNILSGIS